MKRSNERIARRVRWTLFALALMTTLACAPAPVDNSEEARAGIEAANEEFMAAAGRGDGEGLAALYTDDGSALPPNGEVVVGRSALAEFWGGAFAAGIASATLETDEVEGFGETAVEVGRFTLADADGQTIDSGKYVVVWKRVDGAWKLHRDIWNSSQPPPAPPVAAEPETAS